MSFISQMKETQQLDMQLMKAKFEALGSDVRHRLDQELAGLSRKIDDYQADGQSAAANLNLKIQTLEAQNAKVTELIKTDSHSGYLHNLLWQRLTAMAWHVSSTLHCFIVTLSLPAVTGFAVHAADAFSNPVSWDHVSPNPELSHPRTTTGHWDVANQPRGGN